MGNMTRVSRVCGVGVDGARVIVRDVPDSGSEGDAREVEEVARWVESVAGVERVEILIRGVIRESVDT